MSIISGGGCLFQTKETAGVIVTIMEVQPREAGGGEGKSSDEIAFELADMIKERILMKIDPDDAHPSLLRVCYSDGQTNNSI